MNITEESRTASQRLRAADATERRQFVRIRLEAEVRYARVPAPEHRPDWHRALLRDISGGGARLITWEKLAIKDSLLLELPLNGSLICLAGSVQHVQAGKLASQKFEIGLQFTDINEAQRNQIVGLVFRLQLNMGQQNAPAAR